MRTILMSLLLAIASNRSFCLLLGAEQTSISTVAGTGQRGYSGDARSRFACAN